MMLFRQKHVHRLCYCALLCVLVAGAPASLPAQQNTIRVVFAKDPSASSTIGAFRLQGTVYGSLNDLSDLFSLGTFHNKELRKFELKQLPYRIKVSAGNPFVVITEGDRQSIHLLQANVVYAGNSFYVPVASFLPLLNVVFNLPVNYDANADLLRVGTPPPVRGFDISTLRMETKTNGMLIRIPSVRQFHDFESWLKQDGWLYVTIADAKVDVAAINRIKPQGLVRKIVAIQSPTSVQLTFLLSGKIAATELLKDESSNDILVSIRTPGAEDKLLLESKRREIQGGLESQRKRWELDVIVIDPGHGGKDHGATGVTRVREKDITLGIGLKLGKLIEKQLKGVKVVYTRDNDSFVELYRRGQIANEAGGKLFISIHANSLPRKPHPTRGFEVYLLRPGRTDDAIAIAERENAVIQLEEGFEERYEHLTEENFILVTMAQSAHLRASELFADIAQQEMERRLNIPNRGVKQAGFYVLVGASMPNVLVETAYLSNREDERFLKSESGQQRTAEALLNAVKRYKEEYEKLLLEGRDMGAR